MNPAKNVHKIEKREDKQTKSLLFCIARVSSKRFGVH